MSQPGPNLLSLPGELLQHIHLLALNPHFALCSSQVYHTLRDTPPSYVATYLLSLYSLYPANAILPRAVRHPICEVEVVREMVRIWDRRRGAPLSQLNEDDQAKGKDKRKCEAGHEEDNHDPDSGEGTSTSPSADSRQLKTSIPPLTCPELPRRIFRTLTTGSQTIPPLLEHLYTSLPSPPDPNSHRGYPLCRAVLTRNSALIRFLLEHGADPGLREGLAIEVAISGGDVEIVKLLVERENHTVIGRGTHENNVESEDGLPKAGKKRRLSLDTRVVITPRLVEAAMRSGSDRIVQYFVHEKGVMPPLHSIMQLGVSAKPKATVKQNKNAMGRKKRDRRSQERKGRAHKTARSGF